MHRVSTAVDGDVSGPMAAAPAAADAPPAPTPPAELPAPAPVALPPVTFAATPVGVEDGLVIDPETGGVLASRDGRVQVAFPAGALPGQARVSHQPLAAPGLVEGRGLGLALAFELTAQATQGLGEVLSQFPQPVTLTVDLTGLVPWPLPRGQQLWLGYYSAQAQEWVAAPFEARAVEGRLLLQTATDHFSPWAAGLSQNQGWLPTFNAPAVSAFSGAVTFNHPLQIPPGRGGLQPQLSLSYTSKQMDGIKAHVQSSWAGLGWSLEAIKITRALGDLSSGNNAQCDERFTLSLNGAGFDLLPGPATATGIRYYAQQSNALYVERHNRALAGGGSPVNQLGEYWTVQDGQGAWYRLGYTEDAELTMDNATQCNHVDPAAARYAGPIGNRAAFVWSVDTITNTRNGRVDFAYLEELHVGLYEGPYNEKASYLSTITYNGGLTQIELVTDLREPEDRRSAANQLFHQDRVLRWINIRQGASPAARRLVRHYALSYALVQADRSGADIWQRLLTGLSEWGGTDGVTAPVPLPGLTFEYQQLRNQDARAPTDPLCPALWWDCKTYDHGRLSRVLNGYGGEHRFAYESDQRCAFWRAGCNYRVTAREAYDGVQPVAARWTYAYGSACYDQWDLQADNVAPGGHNCPGYYWAAEGSGPLAGHAVVTETQRDAAGAALASVVHHFHTSAAEGRLVGREYRTEVRDGAGALLRQTEQEYGVFEPGPGRWATWLTATVERTPDRAGRFLSTRRSYYYDEYDNLRGQYEYGVDEPVGDGGFETDFSAWTRAQFRGQTGLTAGVVSPYSASNHQFGRSLVITGTANSDGGLFQEFTGLVPGAVYRLRAWVAGSADNQGYFFLKAEGATTAQSANLIPISGWQPVTVDAQATAAGRLVLQLRYSASAAGVGAVYVDEVAVARAEAVGDERTLYRFLYNLTEAPAQRYWVGLPYAENIFAGIQPNTCAIPTAAQKAWFFDGASNYADPGQQAGALTRGLVTTAAHGRWCGVNQYVLTSFEYDGYGNRTRASNPYTQAQTAAYWTTTTYDSVFGLYPVTEASPEGKIVIRHEYYGLNTALDGQVFGLKARTIDQNNRATRYVYDALGRLTAVYRPGETAPSVTYDYRHPAAGQRLQITTYLREDAAGNTLWTRKLFDGLGRVIQTQAERDGAQAIVVDTRYDARGQVAAETVPYTAASAVSGYAFVPQTWAAPVIATTYDALGRVVAVQPPDGATATHSYAVDDDTAWASTMGYSATGLLWVHAARDANGHARHEVLDAHGRVVRVREFDGVCYPTSCPGGAADPNRYRLIGETRYTYSVLDQLQVVTDALTNTTTIAYDWWGRKVGMSDPDMGVWAYGYDAAGNLISQVDARQRTMCFDYDSLQRLIAKHELLSGACSGGSKRLIARYSFDVSPAAPFVSHPGQRTEMQDASGITVWDYDALGRVLSEARTITATGAAETYVTSYGYDALDRVTSLTYPSGEVVTQTYNAQGLLEAVRSQDYGQQWYATNLDYDAAGRLTTLALGNGLITRHTYHPWTTNGGRLSTINTSGTNGVLQDLRYTYDAVGNIRTIQDATTSSAQNLGGGQTQTFEYDALDRLTSGVTSGGALTAQYDHAYSYDALGNFVTMAGAQHGYNFTSWSGLGCNPGTSARKPHAVTHLNSNQRFWYDCNGNMTRRDEADGVSYQQAFNIENQLMTVTNTTTSEVTRFVYDGDGGRIVQMLPAGGQIIYLGGLMEVEIAPNTATATPAASATLTATPPTPVGTPLPFATATRTATPGATATLSSGNCPITPSDDFNRANASALGGNWIERRADLQIIDQALGNLSASGDLVASWQGGTYADVVLCARVLLTDVDGVLTIGVRWGSYQNGMPSAGYNVDLLGNGTLKLVRNGGAWSTLASTTLTGFVPGVWRTVSLRAQGSSLVVEVDGVQRLTATDTTYTAGEVGLWWFDGNSGSHRFDDFMVRSLAGTPAATVAATAARTSTSTATLPGAPTATLIASTPSATRTSTNGTTATRTSTAVSATATRTATASECPAGDTFNRTDGTGLGGNWTETTGDAFSIAANSLRNTSTAGNNVATWNCVSLVSNVTVTARIQIASGNGSVNLGARWGSYTSGVPQQGYIAELLRTATSTAQIKLWRVSGGVYQALGATHSISGFSSTAWYTITLQANSNGVSVALNGATVLAATDLSPLPMGGVGLWSYNPGASGSHRIDDFSVQLLGVAVGSGKALYRERFQSTRQSVGGDGWMRAGLSGVGSRLTAPASDRVWRVYYLLGSRNIAMRETDGASRQSELLFLHHDHLGSTVMVTCGAICNGDVSTQEVIVRRLYEPFGAARLETGSAPIRHAFTGQLSDPTTGGLMFYNARYYHPGLGRFVSADPLVPSLSQPQLLNRMAYVANNPVLFVDPSGYCAEAGGEYNNVFDCELDDFRRMNWDQRIAWLEQFSSETGVNVFYPIMGMLTYFRDDEVFSESVWAKEADAAVLFSLLDGYNMFSGGGSKCKSSSLCKDASLRWQKYFDLYSSSSMSETADAWGAAEDASVKYGASFAWSLEESKPKTAREELQIARLLVWGHEYREFLINDDEFDVVRQATRSALDALGLLRPDRPDVGEFVNFWGSAFISVRRPAPYYIAR